MIFKVILFIVIWIPVSF